MLLDGQAQTVAAVDPGRIGAVLNLGVTAGSLGAVGAGSFAVSATAAADQHWRVGSTVPVVYPDGAHARLRVAAIFDHPDITGDYLFAAAGWAPHAGQALDSMVLIKLKPGAALGPARAAVTAAIAGTGQPRVQDRAQYQASATGAVNTILGLVYVMLALAILIALMGVANTLSLSIHERTRELGLLRALGQTRAQARGMVRWESVIIAVFGTLGGVILGTFTGLGRGPVIQRPLDDRVRGAAAAAGPVPGPGRGHRHPGRDQARPPRRPAEHDQRDRRQLSLARACPRSSRAGYGPASVRRTSRRRTGSWQAWRRRTSSQRLGRRGRR